jgi:hypothetical protein
MRERQRDQLLRRDPAGALDDLQVLAQGAAITLRFSEL